MCDMKRVTGLVLIIGLIAALVVLASCRKDIILEQPDTIKGDYSGDIIYKVGSQIPEIQPIEWRFTDIGFNMWYDKVRDEELHGENASRSFCDVAGEYTLSSGVSIDTSYNSGVDICDVSRIPMGSFALDRSTDTLKMTQYDAETDATMTIKLLRD